MAFYGDYSADRGILDEVQVGGSFGTGGLMSDPFPLTLWSKAGMGMIRRLVLVPDSGALVPGFRPGKAWKIGIP